MDRRFVEHLVQQGLVTKQQIQRMILLASQDKKGLISQLVDAQMVDQHRLAKEVGQHYNLKVHQAPATLPDPALLELLPLEVARKLGALPLGRHKGQICIWVFDPQLAQRALIQIEEASGQAPEVVVGPRDLVLSLIERVYAQGPTQEDPVEDTAPSKGATGRQKKSSGNLGRIQPRRIAVPRAHLQPDAAATDQDDPVDSALDAFEQLLEDDDEVAVISPRASFAGRAQRLTLNQQGAPAPQPAAVPGEEDPWASNQTAVNAWSWDDFEKEEEKSPGTVSSTGRADAPQGRTRRQRQNAESFSLFELSDVASEEVSIEVRFEEQTRALHALEEELKRQRDVVQALADVLMEGGLLDRKSLAKRIKELRRSKG